MSHSSRHGSPGEAAIGAVLVIAGVFALAGKLGIPELWVVLSRSAVHQWWPLLLIVAGVAWWMADRRSKLDRLQEICSRSHWEAKHGM